MNVAGLDIRTRSVVSFTVPGIPQPAGSKRAFVNKHTGRVSVVDAAKGSRSWKHDVATAAMDAMDGRPVLDGPLRLEITFLLPRPKGHYGAKGVRPSAPSYPAVRPDLTKLVRAVEDALTGIVWRDDAQVVDQSAMKAYGAHAAACVVVVAATERVCEVCGVPTRKHPANWCLPTGTRNP